MPIGIVGAGPAGALAAYHLSKAGLKVLLFDASHPREKPCGGGVTAKALALLPAPPVGDPLPARLVDACRFESGDGGFVDVPLERPVAVAARRELDSWLLRQAISAGAVHLAERVTQVDSRGCLRVSSGREHQVDVIVGADGAGSIVRRTLLGPIPKERLTMAAGWFARGDASMIVRFCPGLAGYLWLFPRRDHVGVGICAPLAAVRTSDLLARLEREVARSFPALAFEGRVSGDRAAQGDARYGHLIPSPSSDPRSILEIAGERWALAGDAAALADPITGEGIYYALRSAQVLAETLISGRSPLCYAERALEDFGRDLLKAVKLRDRFYASGFAQRMIEFSARSAAVREVLADLVLGDQGYVGLKRRLLRNAPRFVLELAWSRLKQLATSA